MTRQDLIDIVNNKVFNNITGEITPEDIKGILLGIINESTMLDEAGPTTNSIANLALFKSIKPTSLTPILPSLSIDNPLYFLYSVNNDVGTNFDNTQRARQIVNAVYLDSLFNTKQPVTISGKGFKLIDSKVAQYIEIPLTSTTNTVPTITVKNLVTKVSDVSAKIMYLAIGDSITADIYYDINGVQRDYWGSNSKAIYNILKLTIDKPTLPVPLLLGNLNLSTRSFTYKGSNLTLKGGNAAKNGWTGSSYLNHALLLTSINANTAGDYIDPDISYYLLGLTSTGGAFVPGNTTQAELIRTTLQGKNPVDKNSTLYDWMKVRNGWPGANDTYTGTTTQNNNMDAYNEIILDSPVNPFYSKTKARTVGATNAFSLDAYLARYKTLANDGTTRLTVGSTAGTAVTNATAYDVCLPTHMTIAFGQNDFWLYPHITATQMANTLRIMANVITTEQPTVKVGMVVNPRPGTLYPELFSTGIRYDKIDTTGIKSQLRNAIISDLGISSTVVKTGNIYYVPTYEVTYPCGGSFDQYAETAGSQIVFENPTGSGPHNGIDALASIGDEIYAWLMYSTLN